MLLFYCASFDELEKIRTKGIKGPVKLRRYLEHAQQKCSDLILVVHGLKISYKPVGKKNKKVRAESVPPEAILNLSPYLEPSEVVAGGGYVMRSEGKEPEVLMIYRKGLWDLPKGKLDEGESIEECALREVREEVGIKRLFMKGELGNTTHGYPTKSKYKVKTTHWYHMETPERQFVPQATEDIEDVQWVPWSNAITKVGYEIFRRHMKEVSDRLGMK